MGSSGIDPQMFNFDAECMLVDNVTFTRRRGATIPVGWEAGWATEQVWKFGKGNISGFYLESNQDLLVIPSVACSLCWSSHSGCLRDCKLSQLFSTSVRRRGSLSTFHITMPKPKGQVRHIITRICYKELANVTLKMPHCCNNCKAYGNAISCFVLQLLTWGARNIGKW
jgi:hypothetical protein